MEIPAPLLYDFPALLSLLVCIELVDPSLREINKIDVVPTALFLALGDIFVRLTFAAFVMS